MRHNLMRHNVMRHNQATLSAGACEFQNTLLGSALDDHSCFYEKDYWQQCKKHLRSQLPDSLYRTMIEPLHAKALPASRQLELFAPSQQIANRISQHYLPMIQDFLKHTPFRGQISLAIQQEETRLPQKREQKEERSLGKVERPEQKKRKYAQKFPMEELERENFCIPQINQTQIQKLWAEQGTVAYIYGAEGSGKSTLVEAVARQKENLGMQARVLRFQSFVSKLALVARNRDSTSWNKWLRSHDCLVIDDFQYIKPQAFRSQEELSYLIDEFTQENKLLLFCSDRPVQELPLTSSLLSRLQAARIIRLSYPDQQERQHILKKEAQKQRLSLKQELIPYLASSICRDMRRLKTAIKRLQEACGSSAVEEKKTACIMDRALLDRVCGDLYSISPKTGPKDILKAVARFYDIDPESIRGPARDKKYSTARHLVAYLCTHDLKMSQMETAQVIGRRDHSSVLYARNKIAKIMEKDLFFRRQVQDLCREFSF